MKTSITTGQGDKGETRTLGGDCVSKADPLVECVGCLDELRAQMTLLRLIILESRHREADRLADFLLWLLHCCFAVGADLSDPLNKKPEYHRVRIAAGHLEKLRTEQERLEGALELPKGFIVSATTLPAAQADVAGTAARRLERATVRLKQHLPSFDTGRVLPFLNRLSDFLFVLARHLEKPQHLPVDYTVLED